MRSQNAGLGLKGSSYGASSSDSYRDKLKKLVCAIVLYTLAENIIVYVSSDVACENSVVSHYNFDTVTMLMMQRHAQKREKGEATFRLIGVYFN